MSSINIKNKIYEFYTEIENIENDEELFLKYTNFTSIFGQTSAEVTETVLEEGIERFRSNPNQKYYYVLLLNKVAYYFYKNRYFEYYDLLIECLNFFKKNKLDDYYLRCLGNLLIVYERFGFHYHLITLKKEMLRKAIAINSAYLIVFIKTNIIVICNKLNKLNHIDDSIFFDTINKCLEENTHKLFYQPLSYLYLMLAKKYYLQNKIDDSIKYFNLSKKTLDITGDKFILFQYYLEILPLYETNSSKKNSLLTEISKFLIENEDVGYYNKLMYDELILWYEKNDNLEMAFYFKEKKFYQTIHKEQEEEKIMQQMHNFDLNVEFKIVDLDKKNINYFDFESINLLNIKNEIQIIHLEKIVCVESYSNYIRITNSDGKSQIFKISLKSFYKKLEANNLHSLFFFTNKRSCIINIYWFSNINFEEMTVSLFVVDKHYHFDVSKRQLPDLRKLLKRN